MAYFIQEYFNGNKKIFWVIFKLIDDIKLYMEIENIENIVLEILDNKELYKDNSIIELISIIENKILNFKGEI